VIEFPGEKRAHAELWGPTRAAIIAKAMAQGANESDAKAVVDSLHPDFSRFVDLLDRFGTFEYSLELGKEDTDHRELIERHLQKLYGAYEQHFAAISRKLLVECLFSLARRESDRLGY
jgi:hypothetical protein